MKIKRIITNMLCLAVVAIALESCGVARVPPSTNGTSVQTISIDSEPQGAKVIADGKVLGVTPCTAIVPLSLQKCEFTFLKDGYENGKETMKLQTADYVNYKYPDHVFHIFKKSNSYVVDPTIRAGEATTMVTRDNPGGTALERTIIRWNFDSEPRGSRIFWRVISSIPDQVKNTNELYLTTTPYEETRSFNILGLTYENSRDVTVEIKVTKTGYEDQVKRYNVRQAIDQQEISGFFELVKK
jgi:hypothetical protein